MIRDLYHAQQKESKYMEMIQPYTVSVGSAG
jgi:hypothetical protein